MTNYTVVYTKPFMQGLRKLSQRDQKMVLRKTSLMEKDPFYPSLHTKKMKGDSENYESRVNMDIRILWRFDRGKIIVLVDVGHHDVLKKY